MTLREGIYETLLSRAIEEALRNSDAIRCELSHLPPAESHVYLSRFIAGELSRILKGLHDPEMQAALANELLLMAGKKAGTEDGEGARIASPARLLLSMYRGLPPRRPESPVGISTLLARPGKPDLGHEIARELASADRVDALVSFVTWSGFRRIRREIEAHDRAGRPLRLITTTYTGATEAHAVAALARLSNVEVRVSFDGRRSRLHAKAWLFHRKTGFSSAYIGSANLSASALGTGLEWTMKATEADLPHVVETFRGAFESLWEDPEFERYETGRDGDRLERALREARGRGADRSPASLPLYFTLVPHPHQKEIPDLLT